MIFDDVYLFVVFWLLFFYVVVWGEVREREREVRKEEQARLKPRTNQQAKHNT